MVDRTGSKRLPEKFEASTTDLTSWDVRWNSSQVPDENLLIIKFRDNLEILFACDPIHWDASGFHLN